jgi:hypothetical protein
LVNLVVADKNDKAILYKQIFEQFIKQIEKDKFLKDNVTTFLITINN